MNGKHASEIAKPRAKLAGWTPFEWSVVGDGAGLLITGGVPLDSPPQRGRWGATEQILVTAEEIREWERRYEAETGKCAVCDGTGQVWAGWDAETGHRYRPCSRDGCEAGTLRMTV